LIERRTAIYNHIRALFQAQAIELPAGHQVWCTAFRTSLKVMHARPLLWRGELHAELALLDALQTQITRVQKKLDALGKTRARVALLRTIPGVGPRTAAAVVAYLDDPHRFRTAREVSAYAGLVPRQFQSGTIDRKGRITKRGLAYLRKILVECAWLMGRYNPWAERLIERISQGRKGRRKAAVVALARKLLVCCWAMLRKGQPWNDPDIAPAAA
jgi:transposase